MERTFSSSSYDYSSRGIGRASYSPPAEQNISCITRICVLIPLLLVGAIFAGIKVGIFGLVIGALGSLAMGATDVAIKAAMIAGLRWGFVAGSLGTICIGGPAALCCPGTLGRL